jgi:hypothetical protein
MKRLIFLTTLGLAILVVTPILLRNNMTDNEKCLKQAQERIKAFETEKEAERLNEASMSLENIILAKEIKSEVRARLRKECLFLWLNILQTIDAHLDPKFDPKDVPEKLVQPSPLSDGEILRPGADPAKINDPQLRAEYEKAIAENRTKTINYRLQTQLRRLNEKIPSSANDFIRKSYTSSAADREELKNAIEKIIQNTERKTNLSQLVGSPQS